MGESMTETGSSGMLQGRDGHFTSISVPRFLLTTYLLRFSHFRHITSALRRRQRRASPNPSCKLLATEAQTCICAVIKICRQCSHNKSRLATGSANIGLPGARHPPVLADSNCMIQIFGQPDIAL